MTAPGGFEAPFTPFALAWDGPQMPAADLAAFPSAFEWWYFDLACEDGTDLVLVMSRQNPVFATRKASVYLEYKDPTRALKRIRNYAPSAFSFREGADERMIAIDACSVRIVGATPETMHYAVTIDLPGFQAQLTMRPEHLGFLPTPTGRYFTDRTDARLFTAVSFSAPLMRSQGTITIDGVARPVDGRGYHDHPWGTQQIFWTNLEWNWARTETPAEGVMFAKVTPAAEYEGALTFCYSAALGVWEPTVTGSLDVSPSDWRKDNAMDIRYPHTLGVRTPGRSWTAAATGPLLDTPIYVRASVTWTPSQGPAGKGWVEYFHLSPWARGLAFLGARVQSFFLRPFPWFGR